MSTRNDDPGPTWALPRDRCRTAATITLLIGGIILILGACGKGGRSTPTPTDALLNTRRAVFTEASPLRPTPVAEALARPLTGTLTIPDRGSSTADLAIQITGPDHPSPGETAIFTLTVRNHGPGLATGVELTDTLAGSAVPVWAQPAQPTCGRQGRDVSCELGGLQGGDAVTATLDLSVGGAETLVTGTHLAGLTLNQSTPTCTLDQESGQHHITCRLDRLPAGADAQINVAARIGNWTAGTLLHTATVTANKADTDRSNNRATFTLLGDPPGPTRSEIEGTVLAPVPTTVDLSIRADEPASVIAGRPFTYTFTISNQGELDATGVHFESALPPATTLVAYSPGLPDCEQRDDALVCTLRDPDSSEPITFTLVITGHSGQPMIIEPDPLMPGWPVCIVVKERTYLHIVNCEIGTLAHGQETQVQLTLMAEGVQERQMSSTASVKAIEADLTPSDNTISATISVSAQADLALWSAVPGVASTSESLSYTLTAVNPGPSDATDVVLVDTIPAGTSLISALASQGEDCHVQADETTPATVVCKLGRLGSGEAANVTIVVAVGSSLPPISTEAIFHSAGVDSAQVDPNAENNALTETIPVSAGPE